MRQPRVPAHAGKNAYDNLGREMTSKAAKVICPYRQQGHIPSGCCHCQHCRYADPGCIRDGESVGSYCLGHEESAPQRSKEVCSSVTVTQE